MRVICTAGHVDHGKSTLVRALTGMEPDRFAEERERGLTIDLGFAWFDLPPVIAFVDLPGHARFIPNMLAGAGSVGLALLVVAADEGWMPQSAEHLAILDLLGIRHGVVALTKADAVDADMLDLAAEMVREELAGSSLSAAPIVPVSAVTGDGLGRLREALGELVTSAPVPEDRGRPRLWVDRSFTIRGAGTVVTGTLTGGHLRLGDEVAVLPTGLRGRIRGLQSLGASLEEALPGSRVAVNLSGVERSAVTRGDALGRPDQWAAVSAFDAEVRVLPGRELDRKGAWHLHVGSAERSVRLFPTSGRAITGQGHVRVELEPPLPLTAGDRFVLREAGRSATIAGGRVLDPLPPPRPRGTGQRSIRVEQLERRARALDAEDPTGLAVLHLEERGAEDRQRLAAAVGATAEVVDSALADGQLVSLGAAVAARARLKIWADAVTAAMADHHEHHRIDRAAPRAIAEQALRSAGCPPDLVPAVIDALLAAGALASEGAGLRLPEHRVELDESERAASDRLLAALSAQPFSPPGISEAARSAGASPALVRELEAAGQIVRLDGEVVVTAAAIEDAVRLLKAAFDEEGPLTASRARQLLGTSRKYALPLLEHLDRTGRTRRSGDLRIVRG